MKAVILAGGFGTRLSEETYRKPKPMVEIGGRPILWHILKIYSHFNINEFIICCGYKGYCIKEYFANYMLHLSDVTFHMDEGNKIEVHESKNEPWKVTLVNTGESTETGGRLGRIRDYLNEDTFCFTYGDGLGDVDIKKSIDFHKKHSKEATLTAVQPPGRYGALKIIDSNVDQFVEKPAGDKAWVNGGFFVLQPSVLSRINSDSVSWEKDILPILAQEGQLNAFKHNGFWHPMDTLRDVNFLNNIWNKGEAPWKKW